MRFLFLCLLIVCFITGSVRSETFFREEFNDGAAYKNRWLESSFKNSNGDKGTWEIATGTNPGDDVISQGLRTTENHRFYSITSELNKTFNNKDRTLVLQYSVKASDKMECGGSYIKLLAPNVDRANFRGDTAYNIMFGPDACGPGTKRIHMILNYKGNNKLITKDIPYNVDPLTHVYTLIIRPDQTFQVKVDGKEVRAGHLLEDFDFLPSKTMKDPAFTKPLDWVDEKEIVDETDKKPAEWDLIPKQIFDSDSKKPDDWDDEEDGHYDQPLIDNPEYKGAWKARKIPNPAYQGPWVQPMTANPLYKVDDNIYSFSTGSVGFDLWQVTAGSVFDNIIVTDNEAEAEALLEATYSKTEQKERQLIHTKDVQENREILQQDEQKIIETTDDEEL